MQFLHVYINNSNRKRLLISTFILGILVSLKNKQIAFTKFAFFQFFFISLMVLEITMKKPNGLKNWFADFWRSASLSHKNNTFRDLKKMKEICSFYTEKRNVCVSSN